MRQGSGEIRRSRIALAALFIATLLAGCGSPLGDDDDEQITLRLGVQMTPPELASFEEGLNQIREDHPEWNILLEQTPQEGFQEKFNSQIAANTLPDVIQLGISHAQQGAGQGALLDLSDLIESEDFETDDFWAGALDPYMRDGNLYGVPFSASPDVLFYNTAMFDAAGLPYPTDDWTFEDLKNAAVKLTLDESGNAADNPSFDPDAIVQWGFNAAPAHVFARNVFLLPFGGDPCVNESCDEMQFAAPPVVDAMSWWVDLVAGKHAAPYDPYSGNQTGVPGDPFVAGLAAMGMNGYFAVGQLNAVGTLQYDIVQPPKGPDGRRSTALSIWGYGIAANSAQSEAAFELVQELTSAEFVASYWAEDGHGVPAAKEGADAVLNPDAPPENQQAIIDSMEYGETIKPYAEGAFEAYAKTVDIFVAVLKGETPVAEGMGQIDAIIAETMVSGSGVLSVGRRIQ